MIGWLDCASGVAGDMLLGALVDSGADLAAMQAAVDAVAPEPLRLRAERVERAGLAATRVHVEGTDSTSHRTWADVRELLDSAPLDGHVRDRAHAVFEVLARAEARVHGTGPDEVQFHEVGALDAVADVVAACAGLQAFALTELVVSPVALGGGTTRSAHGRLTVPAPAVVELLRGKPTFGGPVDVELTTPTGAALLMVHATNWGTQPPMTVAAQGFGAGARDLPGHPNVTRLVVGEAVETSSADTALVLETNVDDLDPRLWPGVLDALLDAGASDAWLTPVLMKKGRPAHTLHVLLPAQHAEAARRIVLTHTSAIGLREHTVAKHALPRSTVTVDVAGQPVRVKLALLDGDVVNAQPEYSDVVAAARELGLPAKVVLAQAIAASNVD
ncbi:MAG TPA: nickel pincer cofactor biosynthesis protein LarC [Actinomycetales bacterium]|nr:nickel pincer cofactor biosynthesis protein LarC [Actinomycetales bacterium]